MTHPVSERQLRKLIAGLDIVRPSEVEAILARLGESERVRVRGLLAEFEGQVHKNEIVSPNEHQSSPSADHELATRDLPGVSPWLAARLGMKVIRPPSSQRPAIHPSQGAAEQDQAVAPFQMTPHALASLQHAATSIGVPARKTPPAIIAPNRPWWVWFEANNLTRGARF